MKQVMKMVTMKVMEKEMLIDGHVPSFLTINQLMENEQGRYLSMDVPSCDVSIT